eukprot:gb/GFBE01011254.1/.p1 GENE.gb/GFBE01011254.1/~~gb/GFBE01011254.1/.p1  ORF type:complete len:268 (+),score=52.83 gb/GFBE01011254.1/:1-804(+)
MAIADDDKGDAGEMPEGPADRLLEEVRVRMFEDGPGGLLEDDPRAQTIFERLSDCLVEEAGEADAVGARQWEEYVQKSVASIERRARQTDQSGQMRVTRAYENSGSLRHIDLADWRGRRRARVLFDSSGTALAVQLTSVSGEEVTYTQHDFALCSAVAQSRSVSGILGDRFACARQQCLALSRDSCPRQQKRAKQSVEALCNEIFPMLERLLRRESDEGRQLVPCSEDILEMSLQQLFGHVEKQCSAEAPCIGGSSSQQGQRRLSYS